ncbi:MAG TPA: DUF6220 domain-containing protein [Candidatus Limnocylindrales bacterium]|jgi:hypothetical protein|nr:DUF6220 domain-containing protein [Candidatus Limnocylindrales bacterium]
MQILRRVHLALAWAFVAGVVVQVFLAGLGVFDSPERFEVHRTWGYTLELLPILLLVVAAVGRLGRRQLIYPAALFGMFILQSVFVALRTDMPTVAALHPVNGFGILLVGIAMAREAWLTRDTTTDDRASLASATSGTAAD